VETARGVRRWRGARADRARERVEAVAREAAKQSRRRFLPLIEGPMSWGEAIGSAAEGGPVVVLWERATTGLAAALPDDPPDAIALVVGPEGGITEAEAADAGSRGALVAALGASILRTETAALAAASIVLSRYGRLGERGGSLDPGGGSG
jgi:16S rRNA (uracil1498-N3)-methyltransferase